MQETLLIDRLVAGGDGLGRLPDGRLCFVPAAAPGDRVRVRIPDPEATPLRGEILYVEKPGEGRRIPPCPHAAACGGCPWLHLEPETQIHWRERILREALERTGGLTPPELITVHSSPPEGFRDRMRWKVRFAEDRIAIGFFSPRSHDVIEVEDCLLPPSGSRTLLDHFRAVLEPHRRRLRRLVELVQDVDLHAGDLLTLTFEGNRAPRRDHLEDLGRRLGEHPRIGGVAAMVPGRRRPLPLHGKPSLVRSVGEESWKLDGGAFFQVNASLRPAFLDRVLELAGEGGSCLDLYCGVGFLSLPLARRFTTVLGVESGTDAVALARDNALRAGLDQVAFEARDVGRWLATARAGAWDVAVADPPRAGLGPAAARRLARLGAARIVAVGCDPVSLARDAGVLVAEGYRLRSLDLFDFFPGTPHFETLALFEPA